MIALGWGVLMLPCMSVYRPATWLEGLFTSTSAVCVTGLVVRSTGHDWTLLGQFVILVMIQFGGLGFMTLSSSVLMHLRQRATLDEMVLIRQSWGGFEGQTLYRLLRRCLRLVLWVEGVGAALLFIRFLCGPVGEGGWLKHAGVAAWAAIFHSISAFCNAGFSIWDDSLIQYADDVWINGIMCVLIILGGLGFFVLADIERWLRSHRSRKDYVLRFQSRLVLTTTLILILGGTLALWLSEKQNALTIAGDSPPVQMMKAFFQAVTARTAGFNTLDIPHLTIPSIGVLILLMFIGASPGSCGGGIKTSTFAVLIVLATTAFRDDEEPTFSHRAFSQATVNSAIALFFAAFVLVLLGSLALIMVETEAIPLQAAHGQFAALVFEATSAFGTVGLSSGITPELKAASKLCLIVLMFVGRVGPLGLLSATLQKGLKATLRYPREDVQIG